MCSRFYLIAEYGKLIRLESDASFREFCEDFINVTYVFVDGVRLNDSSIYMYYVGLTFNFG